MYAYSEGFSYCVICSWSDFYNENLLIIYDSNLGAFRFILVGRNNSTSELLFVYTKAAAIKTKQIVFPWELKMRKKNTG